MARANRAELEAILEFVSERTGVKLHIQNDGNRYWLAEDGTNNGVTRAGNFDSLIKWLRAFFKGYVFAKMGKF